MPFGAAGKFKAVDAQLRHSQRMPWLQPDGLVIQPHLSGRFVDYISTQSDLLKITAIVARRLVPPMRQMRCQKLSGNVESARGSVATLH